MNITDVVCSSQSSGFGYSSPVIFLGGAITMLALEKIKQAVTPHVGETYREMIGRWFRVIPFVESEFQKEVRGEYEKFCDKTKESWKKFGEATLKIPEKGLSLEELNDLIDRFAKLTNTPLKDTEFSGTIYQNALKGVDEIPSIYPGKGETLVAKLNAAFTHAFANAYLWNPLHEGEFGLGYFLQYQVVQMVANMFGGDPKEVAGFVTSGGTESLMDAIRMYRNWGMEEKGHKLGDGVIIAGDTVHAAVMKAGNAYGLEVVLVDSDNDGQIDMEKMEEAIKKYGKRVVALIGSAPSYRTGVIDDIPRMSTWAKEYGVGLHVDCCLGGFIVNNLNYHTNFLKYSGVTSLSCDTHKNGWAPKGSSVLAAKRLGKKHLTRYAAYAIPDWSGGVYGTERNPGSQTTVPVLHAYLALLGMGQKEYKRIATEILKTVEAIGERIEKELTHDIEILGDYKVNVIAFRVKNLKKGATYALTHEMKERGFVLNNLKGNTVHLCVTGRFAANKENVDRFIKALKESMKAVKKMKEYPGDAGLYGTIDTNFRPKMTDFQSIILGITGTKEAVKGYFGALLNPYIEYN